MFDQIISLSKLYVLLFAYLSGSIYCTLERFQMCWWPVFVLGFSTGKRVLRRFRLVSFASKNALEIQLPAHCFSRR
uniref:Secreted protein n=1 Tax=Angiostrongylus cantonensis TaxID=6313 RepID=A0A0K0DC19_ANGCA